MLSYLVHWAIEWSTLNMRMRKREKNKFTRDPHASSRVTHIKRNLNFSKKSVRSTTFVHFLCLTPGLLTLIRLRWCKPTASIMQRCFALAFTRCLLRTVDSLSNGIFEQTIRLCHSFGKFMENTFAQINFEKTDREKSVWKFKHNKHKLSIGQARCLKYKFRWVLLCLLEHVINACRTLARFILYLFSHRVGRYFFRQLVRFFFLVQWWSFSLMIFTVMNSF